MQVRAMMLTISIMQDRLQIPSESLVKQNRATTYLINYQQFISILTYKLSLKKVLKTGNLYPFYALSCTESDTVGIPQGIPLDKYEEFPDSKARL